MNMNVICKGLKYAHSACLCSMKYILKKYIIKDFGNSVEVTVGYIEELFQKH